MAYGFDWEITKGGEGGYDFFFLFDYELWIIYTTFCVLKLRPLLIILHTIAIKYAYLYVEMIALIAFYVLLLFKVSAHS